MNGLYFFPPRPNGDRRSVFEKYPELCRRIGFVKEVEAVEVHANERRFEPRKTIVR
ncbi:hypothetical protein Pryu01_03026 [Paraliobacillus ryukyuensis]|uniref:Uncharacterized protein n=1 Tax=Paraliobacillus ryukyuensis TaxID=200904 RepID=A0A366DPP7_9BACI|nr:hypothetical protein DES48_1176 [Paraliobacillus ryukyuensis]